MTARGRCTRRQHMQQPDGLSTHRRRRQLIGDCVPAVLVQGARKCMPCGEGWNENDDTAASMPMSTPAKSAIKPGRFAIVGLGWLEIVCRTCQSVTGRAALLAPVRKRTDCRDVVRHSSVAPEAGTRPLCAVKQALIRPSESVAVIFDLHGFPDEGHCCARTASLVQRRHDGHATRVSVIRACIAST